MAFVVAVKLPDVIEALFDQINDCFVTVVLERDGAFGADAHHQSLRAELLEQPGEVFGPRVFLDEIKHLQISLRVFNHRIELLQLEQADVAMVVLNDLLLHATAIFRSEPKTLLLVIVLAFEFLQQVLIIFQQRFPAKRPFAVWTALCVHLQKSQIDSQLNFFLAILASKLPHHHLARLVIPLLQQGRNIETHTAYYGRASAPSQRNTCQKSVNPSREVYSIAIKRQGAAWQSACLAGCLQLPARPSIIGRKRLERVVVLASL